MFYITLNGEPYALEKSVTVTEFLSVLDVREDRIAVECNMTIIPRSAFPTRILKEGDTLEIVQFIGGG